MVKLHEMYIIFKKRGLPAFHLKFREAEQLHPDLVSGFITAIQQFAKELHPVERKDINLIKRDDFVIMIEDGERVFGAVIANMEDKDARTILKRVVNAFEDEYEEHLDDFGVNTIIFESFKELAIKEFGSLLVNPFYIPQLIKEQQEIPDDPLFQKIVALIDGETNINEIAHTLSLPIEEVCQEIALLQNRNIIEVKVKIEEYDIFSPTEKATEAFSRETKAHKNILTLFGERGIDILYSLDGKRSLKDIIEELQIPFNQLLKVINHFLTEEYVNWVDLYPIMRQLPYEKIMELVPDKENQALAFTLMNMCDGTYSLSAISRKLDIPIDEIKKFFKVFGQNIRWLKKKF
ncbi:MAG: hypothetical protein ACTSQI_03200 [Candidatus Helarchaeota archaeon]